MKTQEEIEQLAEKWFLINQYNQYDKIHSHRIPECITTKNLFIKGYTQCQEDIAIQTISNGKRRIAPFKQDSMNVVWENGYQIALLDNKDKKYTEEDIKKCWILATNYALNQSNINLRSFINSLNKQD